MSRIRLLAYFVLMFGASVTLDPLPRLGYAMTARLTFTAAGDNFLLAIRKAAPLLGAARVGRERPDRC
jgi:ACR3 family arsenite efflux pump ArsB